MPTYALLGATGGTGSAILRALLADPPPDLRLNILVRNKQKLLSAFPDLQASSSSSSSSITVSIFEGTATDLPAMQRCLAGADAIFMCIALNTSRPGERLLQDTARVIVDALLALHSQRSPTTTTTTTITANASAPPSLIVLRGIPLNPDFAAEMPWFARQLLWLCLAPLYNAMAEAADFYTANAAAHSPPLYDVIFVDPPALMDAQGVSPPTGYLLATERCATRAEVSYADLGVAFVEIAGRRREFAGKGVVVAATGKVHLTWGANMAELSVGLKNRVLSWFGVG